MFLGGAVSLVSPNFKFYYSVCAWHWRFCLLTFMLRDTHGLIMHAAEQAGGQREMLLVTLKRTFGWTWPHLSDSSLFFFSPSSPSGAALSGDSSSLSTCRSHRPRGFTVRPVNRCSPSHHAQWTADRSLFSPPHTHICDSIGNLKYLVFSEFLSHHVNVLPPSSIQVCPQYPCSPPPPAPPSTPSHLWILPPPASTPPPRYQVGAFMRTLQTRDKQDWAICEIFRARHLEDAQDFRDLSM